jgi:hypothetical protein
MKAIGYFQIRKNDKPVNGKRYATLHRACLALVDDARFKSEVVELDRQNAIVRRFNFDQCVEIVESTVS